MMKLFLVLIFINFQASANSEHFSQQWQQWHHSLPKSIAKKIEQIKVSYVSKQDECSKIVVSHQRNGQQTQKKTTLSILKSCLGQTQTFEEARQLAISKIIPFKTPIFEQLLSMSFFNIHPSDLKNLTAESLWNYFWDQSLLEIYIKKTSNELLTNFFNSYLSGKDINQSFNPTTKAKAQYLTENSHGWYGRYLMLNQAKESIDVQYFIIHHDITSLAFLALLKRKQLEGVKVRLMVDGRGTFFDKSIVPYFESMARSGVEIKVFNPLLNGLPGLNMVNSNHDKIIIVDNTRAIIGGRNIGDEYFTIPNERDIVYQDADIAIELEKPNLELQMGFNLEFLNPRTKPIKQKSKLNIENETFEMDQALLAMENWVNGIAPTEKQKELFPYLENYKSLTNIKSFELFTNTSSKDIKVLDRTSRFDDIDLITDHLIQKINQASQKIIIQNPYIYFNQKFLQALKQAGQRGVEIIVFTNGPESNDNPFIQTYMLKKENKLVEEIPSMKIYGTIPPYLIHEKVFVVDDTEAFISSYNFDSLSRNFNSEIGVFIEDPSFAKEVSLEVEWQIENQGGEYGALKELREKKLNIQDKVNHGFNRLLFSSLRWVF